MIRTLLYFDIFSYPLKEEEIYRCLDQEDICAKDFSQCLHDMRSRGLLYSNREFYMVRPEPAWVDRRLKGNKLAEERLQKAYKVSRFIAKFPFVRGVMLSGSLSKGYMEEESDIDYFIVTRPGRLWIARTTLVLYKKIFLLNSHKNFCVNYFIDTDHMVIEDKNLFTATEVVFLYPTVGPAIYKNLWEANTWVQQWYPIFPARELNTCQKTPRTWVKRFGEWFLGGWLGEKVDGWCMKRTLRHWKKKFGGMDPERFELSLRSREYVSKHHPSNFQQKVLGRLQQKINDFEEEHSVIL